MNQEKRVRFSPVSSRFRSTHKGLSLLEVLIGTAAGATLMAGLASTIMLLGKGASETGASQRQFAGQSVVNGLTRDLSEATSVQIIDDTRLDITLPDFDRDGVADSSSYQFKSNLGVMSRTSGVFTHEILKDLTKCGFAPQLAQQSLASAPLDIVSTITALHSTNGSGSQTTLAVGSFVSQTLSLATSTSRTGAFRWGYLIEDITLGLSANGAKGTVNVALVRNGADGSVGSDPIVSWIIDEKELTGSQKTLTLSTPVIVTNSATYSVVVTPHDSNGSIKYTVTTSTPVAKLGVLSPRTTTNLSGSLQCLVQGRSIDRLGDWAPSINAVRSIDYKIVSPQLMGGALVGSIPVPTRFPLRDRASEFTGRWINAPVDSLSQTATNAPYGWSVAGTLGSTTGEACRLTGDLVSTMRGASAGLVHARVRVLPVTLATNVVARVGVGDPTTAGCELRLTLIPGPSSNQFQLAAVFGTDVLLLEQFSLPTTQAIDCEVYADPRSMRLMVRHQDTIVGCWDLNEAKTGLGTSRLSASQVVTGISLSTSTSVVDVDHLFVEHLTP